MAEKGYCLLGVTTFKTEASVKARKARVRGTACLNQEFTVQLMSPTVICLPERECTVFQGQSNRGTVLGPITLPDPEQEWKETVAAKRAIYGKPFRIPVGGSAGTPMTTRRQDTDIEPVVFFPTAGRVV